MIKLDLHVHSKHSKDSLMDVKRLLKLARAKGFSAIAITDHDTIASETVRISKTSLKRFGVRLVVGCEVKTSVGDVIGLFLSEKPSSKDFYEVIEEIKGQGGIVVLPHPYRRKVSPETLELPGNVDFIEVLNGRCGKEENFKAKELARRLGIRGIGGSDAHFYHEFGRVFTLLEDCEESVLEDEEEFKEVLKKSRLRVVGKELPILIRKVGCYFSSSLKRLKPLFKKF